MSFPNDGEATYTGNPGTVPRDAVRLLIGDNRIESGAIFSDEEIDFFIDQSGGDTNKAAQAVMAARMAASANTAGTRTIGKTTVTDNRTDAFKKALDAVLQVDSSAARGTATTLFDATGSAPLTFDLGMMDNPAAGLP